MTRVARSCALICGGRGLDIDADMVTFVSTSFSRVALAAAALALMAITTLGVTACVPVSSPTEETEVSAAPSPANSPSLSPSTSASADDRLTAPASARVSATCRNIMDPSSNVTVAPLVLPEGAVQLPPMPVMAQGANCIAGQDSDNFYDWSPASRADWDALVAEFTADGAWFTEDGPRGTYLTYKIDGRYRQTFLFTGDAVILAPTKAATDAVIGPPLA